MNDNAHKIFRFTVEGEPFGSPNEQVTARHVIDLAQEKGVKSAQGSIDALILKCKGTTYSGDELVNLSQDNEFSIAPKVYKFTVNGQDMETLSEKLIALDIIKMAHDKGVQPPGELADVRLEAVGGDSKFANEDWVDLGQFSTFLIIPNTPTPVA